MSKRYCLSRRWLERNSRPRSNEFVAKANINRIWNEEFGRGYYFANTGQRFGDSALDNTVHPGSALLVRGCDEVLNACRRNDKRQLTSRFIFSLYRPDGSVGRIRSRTSLATPDRAVPNPGCRLRACDHHGRSDYNIYANGLDFTLSVLGWHHGDVRCLWPLQAATDSAPALI